MPWFKRPTVRTDKVGMADDANPFLTWHGGELAGGEPNAPAAWPSYALASWWSRVGALLLDDLALLVPLTVLVVAFHQYHVTHYYYASGATATTVSANGDWLDGLLWLLYPAVLLTRQGPRNGQTLGNQAARIRVLRNDGLAVDLRTVIMREGVGKGVVPAALFASTPSLRVFDVLIAIYVLIDYLWPLWERENRALHDLLAGTHVVRSEDGAGPRFTPSRG